MDTGRYWARLVAAHQGLPVMAAGCPESIQRGLAHVVAAHAGSPVVARAPQQSFPSQARYLLPYLGVHAGQAVFGGMQCGPVCTLLQDTFDGTALADHWQASNPPPEVSDGRLQRGSNPLAWVQWNGSLPPWAHGFVLSMRLFLPLVSGTTPVALNVLLSGTRYELDTVMAFIQRLPDEHPSAPGCALLALSDEPNASNSLTCLMPVDDGPVDFTLCATTQDRPYNADSWWQLRATLSQAGRRTTAELNVKLPDPKLRLDWAVAGPEPNQFVEIDAISLRVIHDQADEDGPFCRPCAPPCQVLDLAGALAWQPCCIDSEYINCWWKIISGTPAPTPEGNLPMDGIRIRRDMLLPNAWRMRWGITLGANPATAQVYLSPTYEPTVVRLDYDGQTESEFNAVLRIIYASGLEFRRSVALAPGTHVLEICYIGPLIASVDRLGLMSQENLPGTSPFDLSGTGDVTSVSLELRDISGDCTQPCETQPVYPPHQSEGPCCNAGSLPDEIVVEVDGSAGTCGGGCRCDHLNGTWVLTRDPYSTCGYRFVYFITPPPGSSFDDYPMAVCWNYCAEPGACSIYTEFFVTLEPIDASNMRIYLMIAHSGNPPFQLMCYEGTASRNCTLEQTIQLQSANPCGYYQSCCQQPSTVTVTLPESG